MNGVYATVLALALIVVFLALLVIGLLRSQAEILRRLDSLGIRLDDDESMAPIALTRDRFDSSQAEITGVTPSGEPLVVSLHVGTDPTLLAFLSTTCTSCAAFWEAFDSDSMVLHGGRYRLIVVTLGPSEESPTRASNLARSGIDVVMSSDAWQAFEVPGAPYFAVIDPVSRIVVGEGSAADMPALTTFLGDAAGDRRWDSQNTVHGGREEREGRIDHELRNSGIHPGDPRLHHNRHHGEG